MSNTHLFLKSGFPRAPLQNGLGRFVCQLQRVTIKFCKEHGSSAGIRDFIENDLLNFANKYPGVVVYVKPRRHRAPALVAEYLNGDKQWVSCRNYGREDVTKWLSLLRTQNGNSSALRYRKMWHTDQPSIQGAWTPFTTKNPLHNLVVYPSEELSQPMVQAQSATEKLIELFQKQKLGQGSLETKRAE